MYQGDPALEQPVGSVVISPGGSRSTRSMRFAQLGQPATRAKYPHTASTDALTTNSLRISAVISFWLARGAPQLGAAEALPATRLPAQMMTARALADTPSVPPPPESLVLQRHIRYRGAESGVPGVENAARCRPNGLQMTKRRCSIRLPRLRTAM